MNLESGKEINSIRFAKPKAEEVFPSQHLLRTAEETMEKIQ